MDVNNITIKDGDSVRISATEAPSAIPKNKQSTDGFVIKKKRRRGKSKRKVMKPYAKIIWRDGKRQERTKRINRFRKSVLAKTHAPFNNNQFLMEIHKPDPDNDFQILQTPARTRDSSFSVESEENYFYSLPEDEEEFLTKEFSSVYEDAQSERLSNMSKTELIQEYLLLEAKYDNVVRRSDKGKLKSSENDDTGVKDTSTSDHDSMAADGNTSGTSDVGSTNHSLQDVLQRLKEQEDQINELMLANERLRTENDKLRLKSQCSSSEDSESDSSSTSGSCSSNSSKGNSPAEVKCNGDIDYDTDTVNGHNEQAEEIDHNVEMNGHGQHLSSPN